MKVMVFVKVTPQTTTGAIETEQDRIAMDRYNDELTAAGIRVAVGGLQPGSASVRLHFSAGGETQLDVGAAEMAEPAERIVGFWIWEVRSMEEAVAWARRCPLPAGDVGALELRPFNAVDG